jgi:SOS-response transcriptional repressor LexA
MVSMPPKYYERIGEEIFKDLEIDRDRLGEALSTLNGAVRSCLQKDQWGRASECCQSAHRLCNTMRTSEEQMNPINAEYAAGIFCTYEGIGCLHQASKEREEERIKALLEDAISFFKKSQGAFHYELDRWNEGVMCLNLGRLYRCLDNPEQALFQFQRSLYVFNKLSIEKRQGMIDETLAELEEIRKLFGSSLEDQGDMAAQEQGEDSEKKSTDREPSRWPVLQFLPIISEIAAGKATPTSDDVTGYVATDVLKVEEQDLMVQMLRGSELKFLPEYRYFTTSVVGDSMVDAGIAPGDYVILVKPLLSELSPQHRDVVAAVIADVDEKATLKRFLLRDNRVILKPESPNPDHQAYEFSLREFKNRVRIAGVAVAALKPKLG